MDSITAYRIRRVLASNLETFAYSARTLWTRPTSKDSITGFQTHAERCIANINFAFQIQAIDAETCDELREIVTNITVDIRRLRKVATAKNYICGQDGAIEAAKADASRQVNRLWGAINFITDEAKPTTTA